MREIRGNPQGFQITLNRRIPEMRPGNVRHDPGHQEISDRGGPHFRADLCEQVEHHDHTRYRTDGANPGCQPQSDSREDDVWVAYCSKNFSEPDLEHPGMDRAPQ